MCDDDKMMFLRNMEIPKADVESESRVEWEVVADSPFVGQLDFDCGVYSLMLWEHDQKPVGTPRKLCLRVTDRRSKSDSEAPEPQPDRYYHGGGIADELVALASLFSRRRLRLGDVVRIDDRPLQVSSRGTGWLDPQLLSSEEASLAGLRDGFTNVQNLDPRLHLKFILAARLYHRAIGQIEEEPDLAYLNLVSAVEVLCQDTPPGDVTLTDVDPKLARLVSEIEDDELRTKIAKRILKRERFIKRRFVRFILDHTDPAFWETDRPHEQWKRLQEDQFQELLGSIYDQRSSALHNGEPFAPGIFRTPIGEVNMVCARAVQGDRSRTKRQCIPYPWFFERLVSHVLQVFLRRHPVAQGQNPSAG